MVFKDREKIKASANLQIIVEKNLRNTDEIEFMDYRGGNIAESFLPKNFDVIGTFDDLGNPLCTGRLYRRKFFAKFRRLSAKNFDDFGKFDDIGHFRRYGNRNYFS